MMMSDDGITDPRIAVHGKTWVIKRTFKWNAQFWSASRGAWIKAGDVHGPSANNPKISYFRSRLSAEIELSSIRRSLTPEAAKAERRKR
jgi:hypothetical protein